MRLLVAALRGVSIVGRLSEGGVGGFLAFVEMRDAEGVGIKVRMPDVDDEDESFLVGVIPYFVLETIIKEDAVALGPGAALVRDADDARVRDDEAEMEPEARVCGSAMGLEMGAGREEGEDERAAAVGRRLEYEAEGR